MFNEIYQSSQNSSGRLTLSLNADFIHLCRYVNDVLVAANDNTALIDTNLVVALRTIRNACAGVSGNIEMVLELEIIPNCCSLIRNLVFSVQERAEPTFASEKWGPDLKDFLVAFCQILANMTSAQGIGIEYLWSSRFGSENMQHILTAIAASKADKAFIAFVAAIYNSISSDTASSQRNVEKFCVNRQLSCQLLLSTLKIRMKAEATSDEETVLEWFHMLVFAIVRQNLALEWLIVLSPRSQDSNIWRCDDANANIARDFDDSYLNEIASRGLTTEQFFVIQTMIEIFEDRTCVSKLADLFDSFKKSPDGAEHRFQMLLVFIIKLMLQVNIEMKISAMFSLSMEVPKQEESESRALLEGNIGSLMQLLASVFAVVPIDDSKFVELRACIGLWQCDNISSSSSSSSAFVDYCASILRLQCRLDDEIYRQNPTKEKDLRVPEFDALLISTLQLLSNITIRCKAIQDYGRESQMLPYLLHLCGTDFSNPLRREWALLCVRNFCESNLENQSFIENLTLQGVEVVNQGLKEKGLSVEVNPATGKIDFKFNEPSKGIMDRILL